MKIFHDPISESRQLHSVISALTPANATNSFRTTSSIYNCEIPCNAHLHTLSSASVGAVTKVIKL